MGKCCTSTANVLGFSVQEKAARTEEWLEKARGYWAELHGYEWANAAAAQKFLNDWARRVHLDLNCDKCREHWLEILSQYPPRFNSKFDFFKWTYQVHYLANCNAGSSQISLLEAMEIHNFEKDG